MTPRTEIVWLDINGPDVHYDLIGQHPYSRFPVYDWSLDRILGVLTVRNLSIAQREALTQGPIRQVTHQSAAAASAQ